jgi:hypothetical protein
MACANVPPKQKSILSLVRIVRKFSPMSETSLEKFCDAWLESWTGNRPEKLLEFYDADVFYRDPAKPDGLKGKDALRVYFEKLLSWKPEWVWKRVEVVLTEKGFCLKWEATIPLGEKNIVEQGLDLVEMREGKITRNEVYFDTARIKG